jgi:cytochrome c-type biogenesis protein CcmF
MLNWKRDGALAVVRRLRWPLLAGAAALVAAVALAGLAKAATAAAMGLGVLLVLGPIALLARRWRREGSVAASAARLARTTPLAIWGLALAHAGLGVLVIGVSGVSAWQTSKVLMMAPGQSVHLSGYTVRLAGVRDAPGPNYAATQAEFLIDGPLDHRVLFSERRLFPSSGTQTTQAGIGSGLFGNTFVAIGDPSPDGRVLVRLWRHPLVGWIWAGGMMMALGGMVSLADRRWRFGAARRAVPVPTASAVKEAAA